MREGVCLTITCRNDSKAIGAVLVLRRNESEQQFIIYQESGCEFETCLTGIPTGTYTLYVYDMEATPFSINNEMPAVILPSLTIIAEPVRPMLTTISSVYNTRLLEPISTITLNTCKLSL